MNDNNSRVIELGTEKISKLLVRYYVPAVIAMIATSLYNLADSIFIGHGVGALAISGLSITLPITIVSNAFGSMVGIGAATLMSVKLGQKDYDNARKILGNLVMLNVIISLVITAIVLVWMDKLLIMFGASNDTLPYARNYMTIVISGNVVTHLYMGLNDIVRSTGHPKKAMLITLTAVFGNCALNAMFIFAFGWGVEGAAWATVIAQTTALTLTIIHFRQNNGFARLSRSMLRLKRSIVAGILHIGVAPLLMNLCSSMVVILINRQLQLYGGDMAVGAYGIVNRMAMLFIMIIFGLNGGMQPIVGYNFGAGNIERMVKTYKITVMIAVAVMSTGFLLGIFAPDKLAGMFTTDRELLEQTEHALGIVFMMFPIVAVQIVTTSFFQSTGRAWLAIFLSLTRQMIFLIPLILTLPSFYELSGVWISIPASDLLATLVTVVILYFQLKKVGYKIFK